MIESQEEHEEVIESQEGEAKPNEITNKSSSSSSSSSSGGESDSSSSNESDTNNQTEVATGSRHKVQGSNKVSCMFFFFLESNS